MKRLLIDTDILIDILRGKKDTIERIKSFVDEYDFFCSCITVGEIFAGMLASEGKVTRSLLKGLIKLPITPEIAEVAGFMKRNKKSHTLWLDDCLIAASALFHDCVLATKNTKHYPFQEIEVLKFV